MHAWCRIIIIILYIMGNSKYLGIFHDVCTHAIFQLLSGWVDGPESVTQCPIQPRGRYTYRYNIGIYEVYG